MIYTSIHPKVYALAFFTVALLLPAAFADATPAPNCKNAPFTSKKEEIMVMACSFDCWVARKAWGVDQVAAQALQGELGKLADQALNKIFEKLSGGKSGGGGGGSLPGGGGDGTSVYSQAEIEALLQDYSTSTIDGLYEEFDLNGLYNGLLTDSGLGNNTTSTTTGGNNNSSTDTTNTIDETKPGLSAAEYFCVDAACSNLNTDSAQTTGSGSDTTGNTNTTDSSTNGNTTGGSGTLDFSRNANNTGRASGSQNNSGGASTDQYSGTDDYGNTDNNTGSGSTNNTDQSNGNTSSNGSQSNSGTDSQSSGNNTGNQSNSNNSNYAQGLYRNGDGSNSGQNNDAAETKEDTSIIGKIIKFLNSGDPDRIITNDDEVEGGGYQIDENGDLVWTPDRYNNRENQGSNSDITGSYTIEGKTQLPGSDAYKAFDWHIVEDESGDVMVVVLKELSLRWLQFTPFPIIVFQPYLFDISDE